MQQKNIYTRNSKHFLDVESDTGKPIAKTEKSPSQELLNLWNHKCARRLTTWDVRDRLESVDAAIAASTTEDELNHHWAQLKKCWPESQVGGLESEWDRRDLVCLCEGLNFKGNPDKQNVGLDYLPEFSKSKRLPTHHTTLVLFLIYVHRSSSLVANQSSPPKLSNPNYGFH